jgi:hypothetical protein
MYTHKPNPNRSPQKASKAQGYHLDSPIAAKSNIKPLVEVSLTNGTETRKAQLTLFKEWNPLVLSDMGDVMESVAGLSMFDDWQVVDAVLLGTSNRSLNQWID